MNGKKRRFESAHLHKREKVQLTAEPFYVCGDLSQPQSAALMRLFIELRILVNNGKHVDQMHIFQMIYICKKEINEEQKETKVCSCKIL